MQKRVICIQSDTSLYRLDTQGSVKRKAEGGEETVRLPSPAFRFFKPEIRKPPAFYLEAIAKMARRLAFVRWRVELTLWR